MPNASSPTRLALLVALLLAPGARAEGAPERDPCGAGDWRLDGADAKPGPGAVFNPDWLPALDQVVACLNRRPDSCLEVRGHFDTVAFGPGVEAAFGSAEAVQLARAHGRAAHVIALLHDRGVAGPRLRLQPPSMEPTWRGVGLKLVERCQAMAAHPPVAPPAPVEAAAVAVSAGAEPVPAAPAITVTARPPDRSRWALTAEMSTHGTAVAERTDWGGAARVGVVWSPIAAVYARLQVGVLFSEVDERAVGGEVILAAGGRLLPWLEAGVYGAAAQSSTAFTDPWMHRLWSAGLEAAACWSVLPATRLCATPRFAPLGQRTRRFVLDGDDVFRVPQETDALMRFDLAVGLRQQL